MKELFIILAVIGLFILLAAIRYRKQVLAAIRVWRMLKAMRAGASGAEPAIPPRTNPDDVELVKCARCNSWKPKNEALKFSRGTFYCSSNCVNEAMNVR